ncbi:hypothetical protein TrVE_jg6866 [Triparma verrucosa]|uniref:Uncharacterized protein n=1 Tax=Triparma verrucosa TaxID=1606542 RepID=A0A9W7BS70_9STRA|nr:hypothetical protein TrVE_jg6866 [Triparma verrucosa]
MEALKQKALEKQLRVQEEERQKRELQQSYDACVASLVKITVFGKGAHAHDQMWHACGFVVNLHRKDVPRLTIPHGKHTDGCVLVTSREAIPNRFTANHCKLTYYDKSTKEVIGDQLEVEGNVFYYDPPTHQDRIDNILKKDKTKLTHHEKQMLEKFRQQNAESKVLDFSCTYVPPTSRPKGFAPLPFEDLNEWLSDLSESEEEESESSDEEEGFSLLLDSAIMGKSGKGEQKRKRREEREERRKEKEAEKEKRRQERELRRTLRERHEGKKKRREAREFKREDEERSRREVASMKSSNASAMMDELATPKEVLELQGRRQTTLTKTAGLEGDSASKSTSKSKVSLKSTVSSVIASQQWATKQANESLSTWGTKDPEETESSDDDTGIKDWEAPVMNVGEELLIMQYPDIHDNHHPTELKAKVYHVDGPTIYYRVDPTLDTHRFLTGAALVKFFKEERAYRIVGLHRGRTTEINGKLIKWCHHGMQLTYALQRMRQDISAREQHEMEAGQIEEKQQVANYRKMAMATAKGDLKELLVASLQGGAAVKNAVEALGPINSDRARDLLLNAEAGGIDDVVVLMNAYSKDLEMQSMAMKICVRILLGTHVQHGRYLKQVERIKRFGELGLVSHACAVMRSFPDSPQILTSTLWFLSLLTQNVQNAELAHQNHIAPAVTSALRTFAVFGKASPPGQKWGAACVLNLCKNSSLRAQLISSGILSVIVLLLDNSKSVQTDASCITCVLGAITELSRPPNFTSRRALVDSKIHINVRETKSRVEDRYRILLQGPSFNDDDTIESGYGKSGGGGDDEEGEYHKFTVKECEIILEQIEACYKALSYGIPEAAWGEALRDKKFELDWDLIAAGYKLDAFKSDKKGVVHGKAKKWLEGSKEGKLERMRKQYRSKGSPGSSVTSPGSVNSTGTGSSAFAAAAQSVSFR